MSTPQISKKKLKAIVFTDIVDFTKISADDEHHALELINKQREILKPIVEKHNGEWLKEIGDGLLFSFDSSLEAVRCSIEIQTTLKDINEFDIRIGIHQGDILITDGDVYGDDVNIASRVESFAPVGGIAVSDKISSDISSVKDIKTSFVGYKKLKGVKQETKIKSIYSHNIPSGRRFTAPVIAAYICFFYSSISLLFFSAEPLIELIEGRYENILNSMYSERDWLLHSVTLLFIGYSCLSYSRGVSLKAQKLLSYLAFIYILNPLFTIYFGSEVQKNKLSKWIFNQSDLFFFTITIAIIPVSIFKLYQEWNDEKKKRIWILINIIIFSLMAGVFYLI